MREWLRKIREECGLTQSELSIRSGLSQNYLSDIESGKRGVKLPQPTAKAIADALGFNWTKFYDEEQHTENTA